MRAFIDQLSFRSRVVVVICIVLTTYVILVFDFDAEHNASEPARPGGVAFAQSYSDPPTAFGWLGWHRYETRANDRTCNDGAAIYQLR
jgi:hypothetical protein